MFWYITGQNRNVLPAAKMLCGDCYEWLVKIHSVLNVPSWIETGLFLSCHNSSSTTIDSEPLLIHALPCANPKLKLLSKKQSIVINIGHVPRISGVAVMSVWCCYSNMRKAADRRPPDSTGHTGLTPQRSRCSSRPSQGPPPAHMADTTC